MKGSKKTPQNQEKRSSAASKPKAPSSPYKASRNPVKMKHGLTEEEPARNSSAGRGRPVAARSKPLKTSSGGALNKVSKVSSKSSANSVPQPSSSSSAAARHVFPRKGECEICRQPCRSHCAGCKRVFYCSKQHQQQDWSNHKLTCRPFSIPTQYSSGFHLRPPGVNSSTLMNSNSNLPSSPGGKPPSFPTANLSPELQFMIATKSIPGGGVVFNEKPLLVTANIFLGQSDSNAKDSSSPSSTAYSCVWCSSCLKIISDSNDQMNNNNAKSTIQHCAKCEVPLCQECFQQGPIGADSSSNLTKRFFGGQGHTTEECALISDLRQKIPELQNVHQFVKSKDGSGNEKFWGEFLKDITILRILMFRTQCPWRWESLIALRNNPRYLACVRHNFGNLEELMGSSGSGFPVSNYYLKNICKDKSFQVQDIVRIVGLFCEVSTQNTNLSVLYENRSWLAHACTPNTEQFYRQSPPTTQGEDSWCQNMEIIVKAVDVIEEGSKITMNFLTNFEGGRSALAMRLFQSKGHYCCDTNCKCYLSTFDKSLGIRCDLILASAASGTSGTGTECHACSGIMAPRMEAPNPDKGNLGYGMFMKSKKWECDKCKKTEKYENLHKRISEIAQDLTKACDRLCSCNSAGGFGKGQSFLQLQNKLLSNLSDQHWMVWKAKMRVLKSWSESFGYASEMLRSAVSFDPKGGERSSLLSVVKQKVDMYGGGIYQITSDKGPLNKAGKMGGGVLDLFAKRHGPLSPKRGHLLFDAFYANLIMFLEDYKKELPIPSSKGCSLKRNQIAKENCKKLAFLKTMLEETVESLMIAEGTTVAFNSKGNNRSSKARCLEMATDSLEIFSKVCARVEQCPNLIIGYLNELLELYACQDPHFIHNCVRKSRLKSDPFRRNLDELDFEGNCGNLGEVAFIFGTTVEGQGMGKSSSTTDSAYLPFGGPGGLGGGRRAGNRYTGSFFSSPAAGLFGFGTSGSDPTFGASTDKDSSSEMEDEAHANPFVYSRNSRKPGNKFSSKKRSKSKGAKKGSKGAKGKGKKAGVGGKEDWKSNLWFSSDDDETFLLDDDDFDIGFTYSPRSSTFGADLFNDDELEDLAEWAAMQFMSGKMKL